MKSVKHPIQDGIRSQREIVVLSRQMRSDVGGEVRKQLCNRSIGNLDFQLT
jgi:uncharacterized membrane protein